MNIQEALEIYHSIKEQDPLYFDASVRIANIYYTQGKEMAAHQILDQDIAYLEKHDLLRRIKIDAILAYKAYLYIRAEEYHSCKELFDIY